MDDWACGRYRYRRVEYSEFDTSVDLGGYDVGLRTAARLRRIAIPWHGANPV